jgi:hypothetical protein
MISRNDEIIIYQLIVHHIYVVVTSIMQNNEENIMFELQNIYLQNICGDYLIIQLKFIARSRVGGLLTRYGRSARLHYSNPNTKLLFGQMC